MRASSRTRGHVAPGLAGAAQPPSSGAKQPGRALRGCPLLDRERHAIPGLCGIVVFPDHENRPPVPAQASLDARITASIGFNLVRPPLRVRLGGPVGAQGTRARSSRGRRPRSSVPGEHDVGLGPDALGPGRGRCGSAAPNRKVSAWRSRTSGLVSRLAWQPHPAPGSFLSVGRWRRDRQPPA